MYCYLQVQTETGEEYIASMPSKFRRLVYVRRNGFVITEPIPEGVKVRGEIVRILQKRQVKHYHSLNIWPKLFENTAILDNSLPEQESDRGFIHGRNVLYCNANAHVGSISFSNKNLAPSPHNSVINNEDTTTTSAVASLCALSGVNKLDANEVCDGTNLTIDEDTRGSKPDVVAYVSMSINSNNDDDDDYSSSDSDDDSDLMPNFNKKAITNYIAKNHYDSEDNDSDDNDSEDSDSDDYDSEGSDSDDYDSEGSDSDDNDSEDSDETDSYVQ